jgi:hypothetical protein
MDEKTFRVTYQGCTASITVKKTDTFEEVMSKLSKVKIEGLDKIDESLPLRLFDGKQEIPMKSHKEAYQHAKGEFELMQKLAAEDLKTATEMMSKDDVKMNGANIEETIKEVAKEMDGENEEEDTGKNERKLPKSLQRNAKDIKQPPIIQQPLEPQAVTL